MKTLKEHLHHFMVPRESNNYKAKAIHLDFLTFYLVLTLIFSIAVKQIKTGAVLGFATDINVEKLLELTNQKRVENNLEPLQYNAQLAAAANNKAKNMFEVGYWAHFAPDGTTPWSFILNSGYQYSVAGENLAKGFYFTDAVIDAWMNSPSHKENLLRPAYKDVGFAIVNGTLNGEETTLVVQMFGTPTTVVAEKAVPTPQVTTIPTEVPVQKVVAQKPAKNPYFQSQSAVLAKQATKSNPKFNLFPLFFNTNLIFLAILAFVFMMDFYFTTKNNTSRVSGKNMAHFIFIGFIFAGMYIISKGGIIQ
ncbi:MAG: CAP domain-containing protein [Patescibacteria group bacterium]